MLPLPLHRQTIVPCFEKNKNSNATKLSMRMQDTSPTRQASPLSSLTVYKRENLLFKTMPAERKRTYIAIDLKSFFASVECVERGLDPLSTHLVVADASRTEKTICLAVSPSLKSYGIGGRARLFEVVQRVREINRQRGALLHGHSFTGKSTFAKELETHPDWAIDYIIATPRMSHYIDYSVRIYGIYLQYVAPEDIHVYSIDEVFIDATPYLATYHITAHQLARQMICDILSKTGITATAGIGTNLYLAKVAMDIVAKHLPADANGVRIAELNEENYRRKLWTYRPLTNFWRVGKGIARKLEKHGIYTMGDIARQSIRNEDLLYRLFGVNAELLIDHAWGWEPCTIRQIKTYRPSTKSLSNGQVLQSAYTFDKARVVIQEMAENAALMLTDKHLLCSQLVLDVGYDRESVNLPQFFNVYHGDIVTDPYGRSIPKPAHATTHLDIPTASARLITQALLKAFDTCVNSHLLVRRMNLTLAKLVDEETARRQASRPVQHDLFDALEENVAQRQREQQALEKERKIQQTMLNIKKTFGKNAILKGINFAEGATMRERNSQIGGHKA